MAFLYRIAAVLVVLASLFAAPVNAQAPERRFALVIGNSEYKAGQQPTAANDAGLIAETLRTAGFDVAGARDLDQDTLRRSIREFLDKVSAAGPQAVALVYLAGYGLQFEGENYFVPIDASIRRDQDIPIEAIRISDFTRPLAGTPGPVKLFIVDAARQHPFTPAGQPLASGLALVEPDPGMLIAFNAAPGSIAAIESGPYGAFAQALAEMIGTGGLGLDDLFARVRLRVNEKTNGVAVPWYTSKIAQPFLFTERAPDAPPPPQVAASMELQSRPIREFSGDQEAYMAALERDTLSGYEEFVAGFPDSPQAGRVRALIAVRREAVTWRRTLSINTPEAYWSYLRRYPQGAHVADCQRRLARLAAAYDPPPVFTPMAFADVEPPPPDEVAYLSQPVVVFDGPGFLPPPPVPVFFLPPPPPAFLVLAPPPPPIGAFFLPVPVVAFGVDRPWARPPAFVQAPPRAPIQQITINNTTIINQRSVGSSAPVSAPLPAAVVSNVNSGNLKAPPPGGKAQAPINHATLTGTGMLGKQTNATSVPGGGQPQGPASTGNTPPTGANTATTNPPGGQPQAPTSPGNTRPPGANTATTNPPGGQPQAPTSPGNTRPTGPNTANVTPGGPPGSGPQGQFPPGGRRLPGPTTATTPPGPSGPAPGATPPAPVAPQVNRPLPPPPQAPQAINRPPPATEHINPPAPPAGRVPPPPPPAVRAAPPPPAARVTPPPPPPPAPRVAPPPPPPPARAAPPPPPPPVARVAPQPPPQAAARPAPPPAAAAPKKCVVENGRQVCR